MKKILTILVTSLVAATSWADLTLTDVKYIDANYEEKTCSSATILTSVLNDGENVTLEEGWYIVHPEFKANFTKGITCNGNVHIILADGATLNATTTADGYTGIYLGDNHDLYIYGQAGGTGKLIASGGLNSAGIGGNGNKIVINSGIVTATGGENAAGIGSGGNSSTTKNIKSITINGGTITATGGDGATGIGSVGTNNSQVKTIAINGGTVVATGGLDGYGIGAGGDSSNSTVTIDKNLTVMAGASESSATQVSNDGEEDLCPKLKQNYVSVTKPFADDVSYVDENGAEKTCCEARILRSNDSNVTLETGWYVAEKGVDVNINNGITCKGDVHIILADDAKLNAMAATADTTGVYVSKESSLTIYSQTNGTGQLIASGGLKSVGIGGEGKSIVINGGTITATGGNYAAGIGAGYNKTLKTITINGGTITAQNGTFSAGIGGSVFATCNNIYINGGIITAIGGNNAYSIGSGDRGTCDKVIINKNLYTCNGSSRSEAQLISNDGSNLSGTYALILSHTYISPDSILNVKYIDADGTTKKCSSVMAVKSNSGVTTWSAGWYVVPSSDISITNGATCTGNVNLILADDAKLTATPTEYGHTGIFVDEGNTLTIYGQKKGTGKLVATGGNACAAIGGQGEAVIINGGDITATGGVFGAGIGSGADKTLNSITINGGTITATGGQWGSGIGSGGTVSEASENKSKVCSVNINGGIITATGGIGAVVIPGIGAGGDGECSSIIINKDLAVFADDTADPTTLVSNDGTNIVDAITKQYVSIPGIKVLPSVTLNAKGLATYSAASDATIYTSDVKAYAAKVDGTTINLNKIDDDIKAGTGVVLYGAADTEVVVLESTKAGITTPENDLKATTTSSEALVSVPSGCNYAMGSDGLFHLYKSTTFAANSAFLNFASDPLSDGAKFSMVFNDGETHTTVMNATYEDNQQAGKMYNISGQQVGNSYRGIVIINGKKIIK